MACGTPVAAYPVTGPIDVIRDPCVGALSEDLRGAALAALALAAGGSSTITSTSNAKLGEQLVVDAQGRTLYALSPETTHHLLCKSS